MTDESDSEYLEFVARLRHVSVECRNPRHARGKVAKIVTYTNDADDVFQADEWTCALPSGFKRTLRRVQKLQDRGLEVPPDWPVALFDEHTDVKCKLCGRGLPSGFDNTTGDAAILGAIAARGDVVISLAELHRLASKRNKR